MKKILFVFLFAMTCICVNAQKGSHAVSFDYHSYDANKLKFNPWNAKDYSLSLGLGYQYGLSDLFKVAPSVHFGIYNGKNAKHELEYGAGVDLQTKILREEGNNSVSELYAITGVSYSGLKDCDFEAKHIGGKIGFGIQEIYLSHYGIKVEIAYNTFEKFDGTIGLVYKF